MAFDLKSIRRGKSQDPPRVVVYGEHKIGKSTFAASAPAPIFIPTEDGIANLDVASFPLARTYADVLSAVTSLFDEAHEFQTVVLDSLDWLEPLIWQHVCATNRDKSGNPYKSIEDFGYGKGFLAAVDSWSELLAGLNALRVERSMAIVLLAHCETKRHDDPTAESYDRYQIKLHKSAAAKIQEWADVIGFAAEPVTIRKTDVGFNKAVRRAIAGQGRVLHVGTSPAFVAGNRYNLPDTLPLAWEPFQAAISGVAQAAE